MFGKINKSLVIVFVVLLLTNITYGFFMERIVWYFLGSSMFYLNEGMYFGRGFLFILVPSFIILAPIIGNLSDQFSRVSVLRWCGLMLAISFGLMEYAIRNESLGLIVVALFLFGVGNCVWSVGYAYVFEQGKKEIQRFRTIIFLSICSHFFFFGGVLSDSFRSTLVPVSNADYWWLVIIPAFSFLILFFVKEKQDKVGCKKKTVNKFYHFPQRISRLFLSKRVRWILLVYTLCMFCRGLYLEGPYNIVVFVGNGSATDLGGYIVYSNLALFGGVLLLFWFRYIWGISKKYLLLGAAAIIIGVALQLFKSVNMLHILGAVMTGSGMGVFLATCLYYISYAKGPKYYGILTGVYISIWAICAAVSDILVSILIHNFNRVLVSGCLSAIIVFIMLAVGYIVYLEIKRDGVKLKKEIVYG